MSTTVRTSVEYGNGRRIEVEVLNEESNNPHTQIIRDLAKVNAHILMSIGVEVDSYILSLRREGERIVREGERATENNTRQFPTEATKAEEDEAKAVLPMPLPSTLRPFPHPASKQQTIIMNGQ